MKAALNAQSIGRIHLFPGQYAVLIFLAALAGTSVRKEAADGLQTTGTQVAEAPTFKILEIDYGVTASTQAP